MKTTNFLISLFAILAVFISCDKAEDDPAPKVPKIKTITTHHGATVNSSSYEYDASGRLIKITDSDGSYVQYEYRTGMVITSTTKYNLFPNPDTLLLNDQGLVISQLQGTITSEYGADGKMDKRIYFDSNGKQGMVYDFKSSDGNTTTCEIWDLNPKTPLLFITYEYEHLPNSVNTIGIENMGMAFFGIQDKNLLSVTKRTMHMENDLITESFHYDWDAHNRVVKRWKEDTPQIYEVYTYYD